MNKVVTFFIPFVSELNRIIIGNTAKDCQVCFKYANEQARKVVLVEYHHLSPTIFFF